MIYFPATLTPVPASPGYFWDVQSHKLYSIKVGGVLRELRMRRLHGAAFQYGFSRFPGAMAVGDKYYTISVNGRRRHLSLKNLKKLELVHYDMPVDRKSVV